MLGYGCGVSQYPKIYYRDLYKYQILPRACLGSFEGYPGEKPTREKWVSDLAGQAETFFWEYIEKGLHRKIG